MTTVDLRGDGLLWLINRTVFHPRGYALGLDRLTGAFCLMGDGAEPWRYDHESVDEDALFAKAEAALARCREEPDGPVGEQVTK